MAFVVDASVTISWLLPDEDYPDAREAWRRSETEDVFVPRHWWFEVRNTMLVAERRGRMARAEMRAALERLSILPITALDQFEDEPIFDLARYHKLSFYDAAYLELAKTRRIPLATFDHALIKAAKSDNVSLVGN
ncbi:MAG: type II toxin-antitoxin system VapC family toxin [Variibacter sp.]